MKRIFFLFISLTAAFNIWAQTLVTTSNINLRESPTSNASVLCVIPQGTPLEVKHEEYGWSLVSYHDKSGYVSNKYLQEPGEKTINVAPQPTSPVHYYTNVNGNQVQSPTSYTSVPEGATAQCNDGTYSFSQNHRGTCSHHGGVKVWLK